MTFTEELIAALLEALGLPADTEDPQLVVDTVADLAAQAAGMNPERPSTVAAAARRHGLELVDHDTHEALKRDAAEGRKIAAAAARAKVEAAVDDAVTKGKITPARRKHWVELITADPGMADVLAAVPAETAVPMSEVGHSADNGKGDLAESGWFY
ncbi:phage protease [Mycolicibacterium elephantis]